MFGPSFRLCRVFGIDIRADLSWLVIVWLVLVSLAEVVIPYNFEGLSNASSWLLALLATAGVFGSIILHELGHATTARRCGVPVKGIRLFFLGGLTEMSAEAKSPRSEFQIAVAGPLVSLLLASILMLGGSLAAWLRAPVEVTGIVWYLGVINFILLAFNLLPAFPLDGGRVLRAVIWKVSKDQFLATKSTAAIGSSFGIVLVILGIANFVTGNLWAGVWPFLVGLFLRNAASAALEQAIIKKVLRNKLAVDFMRGEAATVPPDISVSDFLDNYVLPLHHREFPVTENGQLIGFVNTRSVKPIPHDSRPLLTVTDIMSPFLPERVLTRDATAVEALERMARLQLPRLFIVEERRVLGAVTSRDLIEHVKLELELSATEPHRPPERTERSAGRRRESVESSQQLTEEASSGSPLASPDALGAEPPRGQREGAHSGSD